MGVTLDDAVSDYDRDYDPGEVCDLGTIHRPLFQCGAEPDAVITDADVLIDVDVSCGNPRAVGPRKNVGDTERVWVDLVVDLQPDYFSDSRLAHLLFEDPPGGGAPSTRVSLRACDSECANVADSARSMRPYKSGDVGVYALSLPAGRYVVRVSRDFAEPGPVRFIWR